MVNPIEAPYFGPFLIPGTGEPAVGYRVYFYDAGTDNAVDVFTDAALTTPYSPPGYMTLDSDGIAVGYLEPGAYKIVVKDLDLDPVRTIDNYQSGTLGTSPIQVESFGDLVDHAGEVGQIAITPGYYVEGDGGHGSYFLAAAGTANGGTIQDSADPGLSWYKIPDENGDIRAASFGYIGSTGSIQTDQLTNADAYAASVGARLSIGTGVDAQVASVHLVVPIVHFSGGGYLKGTVDDDGPNADLIIDGIVSGDLEKHFTRFASITFSSKQVLPIDWVGAVSGDDALDNTDALQTATDSGAGVVEVPDAIYYVIDATTWTMPNTAQIWKMDGTIKNQSGATLYAPGVYRNSFYYANLTAALLTVVGDLNVGSSVIAGTGAAGGFLEAQAGTSGVNFRAAGRIFSYADATGITASGNLVSTTIEADTLVNDGDSLRIRGGGDDLGNGEALTLRVYFGANVVMTLSLVGNTGSGDSWFFECEITKIGANAVLALSWGMSRTLGAAANDSADSFQSGSVAVTLTALQTLKVNSNTSITQKTMLVDYIPAAL